MGSYVGVVSTATFYFAVLFSRSLLVYLHVLYSASSVQSFLYKLAIIYNEFVNWYQVFPALNLPTVSNLSKIYPTIYKKSHNINGNEFTVIKISGHQNLTVISLYISSRTLQLEILMSTTVALHFHEQSYILNYQPPEICTHCVPIFLFDDTHGTLAFF